MEHLTKLFKILELTRSQPQYGYALAGIKKDDLSNLAEHHYLVAIFAWQLAKSANLSGAKLNVEKVLEFALTHDLGELFGGDIGMPYSRVNKKARSFAKAFEAENLKFISQFFGKQQKYFLELTTEILDASHDEALVAKLADYIECSHYLLYVGHADQKGVDFTKRELLIKVRKFRDKKARLFFTKFVNLWVKSFFKQNYKNFNWSMNS